MNARKVVLRIVLWGAVAVVAANLLLVLLVLLGAFGPVPGREELEQIRNPVATEIYTSDGELMGTYHIQNRQYLEPYQVTSTIRNALIATEDARFYKHHGIDFRSLGRVLFKSILLGKESSGGGSTLSQQLAKNLYPRDRSGLLSMPVNKLREMIMASRIEKIYTKDEILLIYLSTVPFGENTFGIRSASLLYFNKEPTGLRTEETAVLVGMLKATHLYDPVRNPERALTRRNVVLGQMEHYGYLDRETADSLQGIPLEVEYHPLPHYAGIAPYFREFLRGEMETWCSEHMNEEGEPYNLYTDGLKIYTTIDSRLQQYAEDAMKEQMARLQPVFEAQWRGRDLWKGISGEQLLINHNGEFSREMLTEEPRKMEVFTWDGPVERELNTLDSIRHYLQFLQAGFLAMETGSGEIRAWVGGINHEYFKYDHVRARRQVGSTFKPLVYLAALEKGISPCDYFPNDSVVYEDYDNWTPRNADRTYGGYYSLKGGLIHSVNTISVHLLMETGIDTVIDLAHRAGITADLPAVPSLALGTGTVSLLDMVSAYQAIANEGVALDPLWLLGIEDRNGKVLYLSPAAENNSAVCKPGNAQLMTEMLRGVVNGGTAAGLRSRFGIGADVAGKTGTTQQYTDGWFIGFTPSLVAGAWVGGDLQNLRFLDMAHGQGAATAMPIWAGFMQRAFRDDRWGSLQFERFDLPDSITWALDCDDFRETEPGPLMKPLEELRKQIREQGFFKRIFRRKNRR
jgi:penicillin-binding protein 1A